MQMALLLCTCEVLPSIYFVLFCKRHRRWPANTLMQPDWLTVQRWPGSCTNTPRLAEVQCHGCSSPVGVSALHAEETRSRLHTSAENRTELTAERCTRADVDHTVDTDEILLGLFQLDCTEVSVLKTGFKIPSLKRLQWLDNCQFSIDMIYG